MTGDERCDAENRSLWFDREAFSAGGVHEPGIGAGKGDRLLEQVMHEDSRSKVYGIGTAK